MTATQIAGPLILFLLMFVVGLELTVDDFRRILKSPRAVVGGTLGQIILLPLMTWAVVSILGLKPIFGAGAVLVAISPGAGASNFMVAIGRGNIALSVTLTAVASVLAVVTLPTVASLSIEFFLDESAAIQVPVFSLIAQLFGSLLVPISLGMLMRTRNPERAQKLAPHLHRILLLMMIVFVVGVVALTDGDQIDFDGGGLAFVGAFVWTLAAMALGWGAAALLRLDVHDRFTFLVEFAARNVGIAAIVAMSGLDRPDLTLFSGIYVVAGMPFCTLACLIRRRMTL